MKITLIALIALLEAFSLCASVAAAPQAAAPPKFSVEIDTVGEHGPQFTVKNLNDKPMTAFVAEFFIPGQARVEGGLGWDALMANKPPVAPGAAISQYLAHRQGGPLPDLVEITAAIWSDGETFGPHDRLERIVNHRSQELLEFDRVDAILQRGLDENWTRGQFLQAMGDKPGGIAALTVSSTLKAAPQFDSDPKHMALAVREMLSHLTQRAELLRTAKPNVISPPV
jgi:hypothetical protein